jgi:kumamolisin
MANYRELVPLKGSERAAVAGAKLIGSANPDEVIQVTVLLRSKAQAQDAEAKNTKATDAEKSAVKQLITAKATERKHLTRAEFLERRGALEADAKEVEAFAQEYGLTVGDVDLAKGSVKLVGSVANMSKAFGVALKNYDSPVGKYRGRTGPVNIPAELQGVITSVLGLDNRPQARPHFRTLKKGSTAHVGAPRATSGTFTPVQVAEIYDFPRGTNANGSGQCIGIIELGGGFKPADIKHYFQSTLGITPPTVTAISVDGGQNSPGDPNGADGEVMLDIEVAGAVAPSATLAVYFAGNTDQGFYDAIAAAVHDTRYNPSVISISWGGPESSWTQQAMTEYSTLLEDAATLGITVCVAAGDSGSTDGVTDGLQHVDFPASSPYALACGGTKLTASGTQYGSEVVWNESASNEGATGGGISSFFALPDYQTNAHVPPSANPGGASGRGVPDVAGDADPVSGYDVYVDGQAQVIGGTSAVAPLWAGLICCLNQMLGNRIGEFNTLAYGQVTTAGGGFRDITSGSNGAYSARVGWDACTGLGSPIGSKIQTILAGKTAAKA